MDKRKVIAAYRRGFITIQECAQILGIDSKQVLGLVTDSKPGEPTVRLFPQPVNH